MIRPWLCLFGCLWFGACAPLRSATIEVSPTARTAEPGETTRFRTALLNATTHHLDKLLDASGHVATTKGKSSAGNTALAFYLMFEETGNQRYRTAAVELADRVLADMKATKFGVLYIKEKDKGGGETIQGGGPPAFGWYTAALGYIFHHEGNRAEDLKYVARIIDEFPWNAQGWWSADIDIKTGISKEPLSKPSPINKNASIVMAAGMVSAYLKSIDPALSARLKAKADKCLYEQIIPKQEADGFWHYSLSGNDPGNKDILGYFMLTTTVLQQLQAFTDGYRDEAFKTMLSKACTFAARDIAPMTDPNKGAASKRTTKATPQHYALADDLKRGYSLGMILMLNGDTKEAIHIMDHALKFFPYGNAGEDGAHAALPAAMMLRALKSVNGSAKPVKVLH